MRAKYNNVKFIDNIYVDSRRIAPTLRARSEKIHEDQSVDINEAIWTPIQILSLKLKCLV